MKIFKAIKLTALIALVFSLAVGCTQTPTKEQTSAEQAVAAAQAANDAAVSGGYANDKAASLLAEAEKALASGNYAEASRLANESQQYTAASKAISEAKATQAEAQAAGASWRDTADMIAEAEKALAAGDTAKAIELANQANRQAQNAIAQKAAEMERLAEKAADSYTVMSGDSLWHIAGRADVYANPFQWPLIYKANRDQIKDADLIFPGQVFSISRNASEAEINAAVDHARNRGAWALGVVEDSDMAYLAR